MGLTQLDVAGPSPRCEPRTEPEKEEPVQAAGAGCAETERRVVDTAESRAVGTAENERRGIAGLLVDFAETSGTGGSVADAAAKALCCVGETGVAGLETGGDGPGDIHVSALEAFATATETAGVCLATER